MVEDTGEEVVVIIGAVVMVAPWSVVVAAPSVMGFKAVFQMVKLYVPHPASRLPVPHIVALGS